MDAMTDLPTQLACHYAGAMFDLAERADARIADLTARLRAAEGRVGELEAENRVLREACRVAWEFLRFAAFTYATQEAELATCIACGASSEEGHAGDCDWLEAETAVRRAVLTLAPTGRAEAEEGE